MEKEMLLFIKKVRRRYVAQLLFLYGIIMSCIGLGIGTLINIMACFIPIYRSFFISVLFSMIVTLGGILCYGVFHFPNKKKMALVIDKRGLKERLTTSLELMEQSNPLDQSKLSLKELQLKDTIKAIRSFPIKERFPVRFPKKPFWLLLLVIIVFSAAALIPSPKKSEAMRRHEVAKEVGNQIKKVEKVIEKVEKIEKMDKTLEKQLKKMLKDTKKEIKKANSKEEAKKAIERFKTKVKQNLDNYRKKTENRVYKTKNTELKKILENKKSSKQTKNKITKKMLEALKKELKKQMKKAESAEEKEAIAAELSQLESLEQIDDIEDLLESLIQYKKEEKSSKDKNKKNSGTGQGSGNSGGAGTGTGKGNGNGAGSGIGGGKNTGSKQGIEMENTREENPEKVSIPGRKKGKDKNLKGQTSQGKSSNSKGGIGYGYAGEEVDYNQVIGDYIKNAYNKLDKNEVPAEMEDVVKEYFEGIHQGE